VDSLPKCIQSGAKSFFKGSSNKYSDYSVCSTQDGGYLLSMTKPGNVPGSYAVYYRVMDSQGTTLRVYKETYDPNGNLVHSKEK